VEKQDLTKNEARVLFLCTGNSCRSQMAEAIVNSRLDGKWQAFSAGTRPAGYVHPIALQVLSEIGVNFQGRSKHLDEYRGQQFDLVVTLCDSAADECPVWLGSGQKVHLPFPDPASVSGTQEQKITAFRQVRDGIANQITSLLTK
jgi:arsenate reductase